MGWPETVVNGTSRSGERSRKGCRVFSSHACSDGECLLVLSDDSEDAGGEDLPWGVIGLWRVVGRAKTEIAFDASSYDLIPRVRARQESTTGVVEPERHGEILRFAPG